MEKKSLISTDTLIPVGLAISLCLLAYNYGVMVSKVNRAVQDIGDVKQQVTALNNKLDSYLTTHFSVNTYGPPQLSQR